MSKIILSGHIVVSDADLQAVLEELPTHIKLTREEPGCTVFEVTQDADRPNRFSVYEEFADQESFDQHQARVRASHWGQVAADVERHYEITRAG